jgi:hypothetical protein
MKCKDTEKYLEIALGGALNETEQSELEKHLQECTHCQQAVEKAQRDKQRIKEALKPHRFSSPSVIAIPTERRKKQSLLWLKIAAGILICIGLGYGGYKLLTPSITTSTGTNNKVKEPTEEIVNNDIAITIKFNALRKNTPGDINLEMPPLSEEMLTEDSDIIIIGNIFEKLGRNEDNRLSTAVIEVKRVLKGKPSENNIKLLMEGKKIHLECGVSSEQILFNKGDKCLLFLKKEGNNLIVYPDRADNVCRKLISENDAIITKITTQLAKTPDKLIDELDNPKIRGIAIMILCNRVSNDHLPISILLTALQKHKTVQGVMKGRMVDGVLYEDECDICKPFIDCILPKVLKQNNYLSNILFEELRLFLRGNSYENKNNPTITDFSPRNERYPDIKKEMLSWWMGIENQIQKWAQPVETNAIENLVKQLGNNDWNTREAASNKLFNVGPLVISYLTNVKDSSDIEIRKRATEIIKKIKETMEYFVIDATLQELGTDSKKWQNWWNNTKDTFRFSEKQ